MVKATRITINSEDKGVFFFYEDLLRLFRKVVLKFSLDIDDDLDDMLFYMLVRATWIEDKIKFEDTVYVSPRVLIKLIRGLDLDTPEIVSYIEESYIVYDSLCLETKM